MKLAKFTILLPCLLFSTSSFADISKCKGTYDEITECINSVESKLLKKYSHYIKRNDDTLTLISLNKFMDDKKLTDGKGMFHTRYKVHSFYPNHQVSLVSESAHEYWGTQLFQHKTGRLTRVPGKISFSPSQKTFVSFNSDIEAGFTENSVAIYNIQDFGITLHSKFVLENFGVTNAKFINNSEIKLTSEFWSNKMKSYGSGQCILENKKGIWQFKTLTCSPE